MELKLVYKNIFLATIVYLFFLIILGNNKVSAGTFSFQPPTANLERQCVKTVNIMVNPEGVNSNAAGIDINFDPNQVQILSITNGNAYDVYIESSFDNTNGTIEITAFSLFNVINSEKRFATIEFNSTQYATNMDFMIDFQSPGYTLDSNIAHASTNADILSNTVDGSYTFISGPCFADTIPPVILNIDPINNETNYVVTDNLFVKITDNQSGVDLNNTYFLVNGVRYNATDPQVTVTGSALNYDFEINPTTNLSSDNANTLNTYTKDLAGNSRNNQIIFNIPVPPPPPLDTIPPVLTFIDPTNLQTNVKNDKTLEVLVTDNDTGVDINTVRIYFNGVEYTLSSPEVTYTGTTLNLSIFINPTGGVIEDSYNVLRVKGEDLDGNEFDDQILFNIPTDIRVVTKTNTIEVCTEEPEDNDVDTPVSVETKIVYVESEPKTITETKTIIENIYSCPNPSTIIIKNDITPTEPEEVKPLIISDSSVDSSKEEINLSSISLLITTLSSLTALTYLPNLFKTRSILKNLFLKIFFINKNKKWGRVINIRDYSPVHSAKCTLWDKNTNKKLETTYTDSFGNYGFKLKQSGNYLIKVSHTDYDLKEEDIFIKDKDKNIKKDIQAIAKINSAKTLENSNIKFVKDIFKNLVRFTSKQIFYMGFIISIINLYINNNTFNTVLFGIYLVMLILDSLKNLPRKNLNSIVADSSNNLRIPNSEIKLHDPITNELLYSFKTDNFGEFHVDIPAGKYMLICNSKGYTFPSKILIEPTYADRFKSTLLVNIKRDCNNLIINMDKISVEKKVKNLINTLKTSSNSQTTKNVKV